MLLVPADWRVAGMTYLKYSNLCADMVRAALKEPAKAKAKAREIIYFRQALWKDGQPQKQVITDTTGGSGGKLS
ncbi:ATP synthase subunit epsilon [Chlorella vulgaris]